MQDLEKVIGRVVAARRKRLGLSQEALAEVTGLHPTYIGLIERGLRCPSARVILALGEGLGTTGSSLLASVERAQAKEAPKPARYTKVKAKAKRTSR